MKNIKCHGGNMECQERRKKCMTAEYVAAHNSFCPVMFNIYVYWT